jgi:peroxiredoxin
MSTSGAQLRGTKSPRPGEVAPAFALPDTLGAVTRPYDFRQRQPVLLVFIADPDVPALREWLSSLVRCYARLDELGVAALIIAPVSVQALRKLATDLDLSFRLLSDEGGAVTARYGITGEPLALFALNRYGYLLQSWRAKHTVGTDTLPPVDAALDRIAFAEMGDCGCGLPAWPRELMESEDE